MSSSLTPLSRVECMQLLESNDLGRIAVVHDGSPVVFPVNYRIADYEDTKVIVIRTRTNNTIDHPDSRVAFEIDNADVSHGTGWSVLVRGVLRMISPGSDMDSYPMITDGRTAWRVIVPDEITGRRVDPDPSGWTFNPAAYL
jgi:hypothetical protein